jgi:hypothetical protein
MRRLDGARVQKEEIAASMARIKALQAQLAGVSQQHTHSLTSVRGAAIERFTLDVPAIRRLQRRHMLWDTYAMYRIRQHAVHCWNAFREADCAFACVCLLSHQQ